jgi:hypothetical protein
MTPKQWARVFAAGQDAIPTGRFVHQPALTPDLYPIAAVAWALEGMRHECERLAEEGG